MLATWPMFRTIASGVVAQSAREQPGPALSCWRLGWARRHSLDGKTWMGGPKGLNFDAVTRTPAHNPQHLLHQLRAIVRKPLAFSSPIRELRRRLSDGYSPVIPVLAHDPTCWR